MILVYVAGAYRAKTAWEVELNIRSAEAHGLELARHGRGLIVPIIPHTMYRFFDGVLPDAFFLEGTKEQMRRCDAVAVAPGWEISKGSAAELEEAERLHLPRFFQPEPADQAAAILAYAEFEDLGHQLTKRILARRRESLERGAA